MTKHDRKPVDDNNNWDLAGGDLTARLLVGAVTEIGVSNASLLREGGLGAITIRLAPDAPPHELWFVSGDDVIGRIINIGER